jgi:hypothetical protein
MYTRLNRFEMVASLLKDASGTLADVGARDRILKKYLPASLQYKSADFDPGHDYRWNLENPIDCPDGSFDFVVALDVLEHVENIHAALKELIRLTRRRLFISLPNMSFLSFRINFLMNGEIGRKYSLLPAHQGDRHRWLTVYPQMNAFIAEVAEKQCGCTVKRIHILDGYTRLDKIAARLPLPPQLRTYIVLYEITKNP